MRLFPGMILWSHLPSHWLSACLFFGLLTPWNALAFAPQRPTNPTLPLDQRVSLSHSHNDYEQPRPLWDALDANMASVEADIWLKDGRLEVSHWGFNPIGTLESLYLDPLNNILKSKSSVYGDGKPFFLWIEIKDTSPEVVAVLAKTLEKYPFLSRFSDDQSYLGAVTVILTGDLDNKVRYVESTPLRFAVRDGDWFSERDPPSDQRWTWISLNWFDQFQWNGIGEFPEEEKIRLEILVNLVHSKGRKIRFYGTPEEEGFWNEALLAQVDLIGTDHPTRLQRFLSARP